MMFRCEKKETGKGGHERGIRFESEAIVAKLLGVDPVVP